MKKRESSTGVVANELDSNILQSELEQIWFIRVCPLNLKRRGFFIFSRDLSENI